MSCINEETREALLMEIDDLLPESNRKVKLANFINDLPKCTTEEVPKGKKKMRPLSKYNVFLSKCMKIDKSFDKCIPKWNKIKECITNGGNHEDCSNQVGY